MRRGIAELNGEGETVGGIVVIRYGANARQVIQDVKERLDAAMKGLPPDVTCTIAYDRSALIERAVRTLEEKLLEESIVVALVCLAFLMHLRSALVAILILPIAVLMSFIVMFGQGISSNIMSLGGIAIAIGAMVDAVIIMIENVHKHIEHDGGKKPHWEIIRDACVEVGPTLFYSLLVISVSFIRCSRCRRRKDGCSNRWPSQKPTRWPPRRCSPSRSHRSSWASSSAAKSRPRRRIPSTAFSFGCITR